MDAVISDIHGNLEALVAVLDAIRVLEVDRIICLGDLVGYGPDSIECIRQSAAWDVVIQGDWDHAILGGDERGQTQWMPVLERHIRWVREQVRLAPDADQLQALLGAGRESLVEHGRCFTHGTPCDLSEWIFPEDLHDVAKLDRIAEQFDRVCVCGHSHIPALFQFQQDSGWTCIQPATDEPYPLDATKSIVVVGSVGQPRDGDCRASFVTLDDRGVRFHRVEYDVDATVQNVVALPELDNMYGERLLWGR